MNRKQEANKAIQKELFEDWIGKMQDPHEWYWADEQCLYDDIWEEWNNPAYDVFDIERDLEWEDEVFADETYYSVFDYDYD